MQEKAVSRIMLTLLSTSMLTMAFNVVLVSAGLSVHNIDSGEDFATIQEAIDDPDTLDGHTIFVEEGIHHEHIVVHKSLSLVGENRNTTFIDGSSTGKVVEITASNVHITGFTIQRGSAWTDSGIIIRGSGGHNISGNIIKNNYRAIFFYNSSSNIVKGNDVLNNWGGIEFEHSSRGKVIGNRLIGSYSELGCGLRVEYSSNFTVTENIVTNNRYTGIFLFGSDDITLRNNNMTRNRYNFHEGGGKLSHYLNDIDISNTADGKPIYHLINQHNLVIDPLGFPQIGHLTLVNSTNITVKDLNLTNTHSIVLAFTHNSTIENVNISETSFGFTLMGSINCSVVRSLAWNSFMYGIYVVSSKNCSLVENRIYNGSHRSVGIRLHRSNSTAVAENVVTQSGREGFQLSRSKNNLFCNNHFINNNGLVYLLRSHNNSFYRNNFINNVHRVYFLMSYNNTWNFGGEGNYWSDYEGVDTDSDGIGDTPYIIDENNQDNYPLMHVRIEALEELAQAINSWDLKTGTEKSLVSKLQVAQRSLDKGNYKASIGPLTAFSNYVGALQGKKLTNEQANYVRSRISEAQRIIEIIRG